MSPAGVFVMVQVSADGERALVIMSPAKGGGAEGASVVGELTEIASDKKSVKVAVTIKDKNDPKAVKTEEVANVAAFLLSPRSSGINAQRLVVDAGMSTNYFDASLIKAALGGPAIDGS